MRHRHAMLSVLTFLLAPVHIGFPQQIVDVCGANRPGSRTVTIRGTGRFAPDGLVLADVTCPIARSGDIELPSMIVVGVQSFASPSEAAKFKHEKNRSGEADPLVQVLVQGELACRDVTFNRSDSGQIIGGNGFGDKGLIPCRLSQAKILKFEWFADGVIARPPRARE